MPDMPSDTKTGVFQALFKNPIVKFFMDAIDHWLKHRASSKAAALAYFAIFSLTPLLVIIISVFASFYGEDAARGQVVHQIAWFVGPTLAEMIQNLLKETHYQPHNWLASLIATAVLFTTATSSLRELKQSLDEIWEVDIGEQPAILSYLRTQLIAIGLIFILATLFFASLVLSGGLAYFQKLHLGQLVDKMQLIKYISNGISILSMTCLFAFIYKTLPEAPIGWQDVILGALITACLFAVGKYFIGLYLANTNITNSFGAAGSLAALMLWIYYSANIFFFGAVLTRQYAISTGSLKNTRWASRIKQKFIAKIAR